jgi:protein-disulfide isomerase
MTRFGFRIILICATLVLAAPLLTTAQNSPRPIATVNGQPIYEDELMSLAGASLLELRNQEYKLQSDTLDKLVLNKLIEAEAKKKGLTSEELFEREVDSKIPEPSDDEAKGFYLAGKDAKTLPFDQIKSQVKRLLKTTEIQQAREKYADSLRAKADIIVLLRPPKLEIGYDAARVRGDEKAPVTIVEFADFQCPYCKSVQATLNALLVKYQGQVKLAYRDFPLRALHPQAQIAAEAGRCAGEHGKFWEYHDALYADQKKLSQSDLLETARRLGLPEKAIDSCLASGKFRAKIEQDIQEGTRAGVDATPGFFINGVFLNGAMPAAEFEKIINRELQAIRDQNSTKALR